MAFQNRDEKFKDITLDDVAVAIEILEYYLTKLQKAKTVMSRFQQITGSRASAGGLGGMTNMSFDDIVNMAVAVEQKKRGQQIQEPLETELTDEDIKRMKETVNKVRGQKAETQP